MINIEFNIAYFVMSTPMDRVRELEEQLAAAKLVAYQACSHNWEPYDRRENMFRTCARCKLKECNPGYDCPGN